MKKILSVVVLFVIIGAIYIYQTKVNLVKLNSQNSVTITAQPNGVFSENSIWNIQDESGTQWIVDYKDAAFFESWMEEGKEQTRIGGSWLEMQKEISAPGYDGPGVPGKIRITGTIDDNGIVRAIKIVKDVQ